MYIDLHFALDQLANGHVIDANGRDGRCVIAIESIRRGAQTQPLDLDRVADYARNLAQTMLAFHRMSVIIIIAIDNVPDVLAHGSSARCLGRDDAGLHFDFACC